MQTLICVYVVGLALDVLFRVSTAGNQILLIENSRGKDTRNAATRVAQHHVKRLVTSPVWPVMWVRSAVNVLRWYVKNR